MSEFKFACPVCGQHITAQSEAAGSQLECPTCFRKIVVPQPPALADPKFVLSASEANKPRPPQTLPPPPPVQNLQKTNFSLVAWILVAVACIVAVALFLYRHQILNRKAPGPAEVAKTPAKGAPPPVENAPEVPWMPDLTNIDYPENQAGGKIHGRGFVCQHANLQGGTLTLREGAGGPILLGLNIYFFAHQAEEFGGKSLEVKTNDPIAPRVTLRWRDGDQPVTENFNGGYALKLDFGQIIARKMDAKIYLCLPDASRSVIGGHFTVDIRKPPAPKKK